MKKLFLILCLFVTHPFISSSTQIQAQQETDASANVHKQFEVNTSVEETIKWLESNQKIIREALRVQLVEDMGNGKLKVKKGTPIGDFVCIIQESTLTTNKGNYVYHAKLIECLSGGIVYSDTYVMVSKINGKTCITMKMSAGANNPKIHSVDMKIDFVNQIGKFKRLIESKLN